MAFFDDLGKVLAETGHTVVNKTKDLTEITRLSAKVTDLQRKNEQLYKTIGKLYVEHYGDTPEDVFKGAVFSIKENQKKITGYKDDIKQLKGIKKCSSCGADVSGSSQFCSKCGAKVEDADVVADVEAVVTEDVTEEPKAAAAEETVVEDAPTEETEETVSEETPDEDAEAVSEETPAEDAKEAVSEETSEEAAKETV